MTTITDEQLYANAERIRGKVVVITGAANGIGKETALQFGKYGAKVVIGDLDLPGAEKVAAEISKVGGQSIAQRCDVTNWDDQVSLFDLAESKYGSVDVVVPNAGITELGNFSAVKLSNGKPTKPNFKTLEINLISVMYTAHIGLYYMKKNKAEGDLKSLIFLGSMASWQGIPDGSMYSAAKHGVLGLMRSLHLPCLTAGIRVGVIHPWFADTAIVPSYVKVALAGIPLTPVTRIAGAIVCAATDSDMETSGCPWLLPDDGYVFRLEKEELKEGVYGMIDARAQAALRGIKGVQYSITIVRDLWRVLGRKVVLTVLVATATRYLYQRVKA